MLQNVNTNYYYLNSGVCTACTAGSVTVKGSATKDANAETACLSCPDGTQTCSVDCTLDGSFKCPAAGAAGGPVFTATACMDGYLCP